MIYELDGIAPVLGQGAWVAPDANLIGKVVLEDAASVWFGATLRGDNEEIRVGHPACIHVVGDGLLVDRIGGETSGRNLFRDFPDRVDNLDAAPVIHRQA